MHAAVDSDADETVCTCSPGVHWIRSRVTLRGIFGCHADPMNVATVPAGGSLGLRAEEGRAKLRKACGTRTEGKNTGFPNGNPHRNCFAQWGTPRTETSQYRQEKKT